MSDIFFAKIAGKITVCPRYTLLIGFTATIPAVLLPLCLVLKLHWGQHAQFTTRPGE